MGFLVRGSSLEFGNPVVSYPCFLFFGGVGCNSISPPHFLLPLCLFLEKGKCGLKSLRESNPALSRLTVCSPTRCCYFKGRRSNYRNSGIMTLLKMRFNHIQSHGIAVRNIPLSSSSLVSKDSMKNGSSIGISRSDRGVSSRTSATRCEGQ